MFSVVEPVRERYGELIKERLSKMFDEAEFLIIGVGVDGGEEIHVEGYSREEFREDYEEYEGVMFGDDSQEEDDG